MLPNFFRPELAAFLPDETMEIVKDIYGIGRQKNRLRASGMNLSKNFFRIERARVKRDAIALKTGGDGKTRDLEYFYEEEAVDAKEKQLIKEIQSLGREYAEDFSKISFPFTPFWMMCRRQIGIIWKTNDLDRLLVNDHSNFEEGWGKVTGLIKNPGANPKISLELLPRVFKEYQAPWALGETQKKFEPLSMHI